MIVEFAEYIRGKPLTPLKKLFKFLKKKGLNVKHTREEEIDGGSGFDYKQSELISGDDFLIYYENTLFDIDHMYNITKNDKGERCGAWKNTYFRLDQFDDIYEFVKDIKETNDMEVDLKKYNL